MVRLLGAPEAWSRTCISLLSLNRGYNYGMMNVIERRPFSELGDQQLLEQTRRLAANQRCIEVHILDHLDEIDRRGLALRRGFSSLFDYAVRELRFSDAAAQRRIQAMRLCRRHGWVRACLQSGELSMTSAAQLEATFAGAERAERQSHTGHRNVGQGRGHDQDHDSAGGTRQLGLPAAPGEADEQGERGHRSEPGFAPPAGECSRDVRERGHRSAPRVAPPAGECTGDVAAGNTPAVPVASRSGAQAPGAGHAGALLPRTELNGNASPFPAPSCAPVAAPGAGAGAAAPSSDEGPAPQLLPPTYFSASTPEPELVMAPAESRHTASRAPEPLRDDPVAELSPGTVSAAPLLHPQRQRELIEQAAGMSTRQVAGLLAAAAPEVLPPRDTLRAVAPDRYTLKVSIDQECEQGLRLLKDLMSHVDPRMSWGDLVARVVREAVTRHDPRGGGRGQRRKGADSAGASPRRAPKETRAAGAEVGPAQRVGESSPRAPNRTGAAGAAAEPAQREDESSPRAPNRTPAAGVPGAPARRRGGATSAPQGDAVATERQNPIAMLANAAPPRQSAPAALLDGARAGGTPSGAPAATPAPKFASGALADGSHAGTAVPGSSVATSAPERALGVSPDGGPSGASAGAAGGPRRLASLRAQAVAGRHCGAGAGPRRVPRRRTARRISRGSGAHDPRTCSQPPPIPAAAPHSRGCPAPHLATRRWTLLLSRSALRAALHLFPSAADRPPVASRRGRWPGAVQPGSALLCSSQNAPRLRTGCSAGAPDVAPPPRCWRATRLRWPTACRWPGGDTLAGRCRCAHARRCRGLPSTISCRFRRSHASAGRIRVWWQRWQQTPKRAAPDAAGAVLSTWRECTRVRYAAMPSGRPCVYYCQLTFSQGPRSGPPELIYHNFI